MLALTNAASLVLLATAPSLPLATPAPMQPILGGPVIPGLCVLSPDAVVSGSKVGQAANARFQQIAQDAQRTLQAERTALETEAKSLDTLSKSLPAAQAQERRTTLASRATALQAKINQRNRELEYTRVSVVQRISQQAQPLIADAYAAHHCGLLFRREGMLAGNPTNDLTAEVVRALDGKLTSLSFDRIPLPTTASSDSAS